MRNTPPAIATGALLLTLGLSACAATTPSSSNNAETIPTTLPQEEETVAPTATSSAYRDGEFTATGWYGSLPSHHDVTLTIQDDTVTDVEITTPAEDETSLGYQQRFAAALPDAIIGRNIDELDVDRLAGSSGCSEGFMDALAKIKEESTA